MNIEITETEERQLSALNKAVTNAILARRDFLDTTIQKHSKLQVGGGIYNVRAGERLGRVSRLYRFWRDQESGVNDIFHSCDYEYETAPRCFDNTSRQPGILFGTREEASLYANRQATFLRVSSPQIA